MKYQIRKTADGSSTIYLPEMDEQYHSLNGAIIESTHVFINNGFLFHPKRNPVVFEVGFGTGLNCLLTAFYAEKHQRVTTFYSVEKVPLDIHIAKMLDYGSHISDRARKWYKQIHLCSWGTMVQISDYFRLYKMKLDFTYDINKLDILFDLVYFDAFGPDKQPEMWTPEIFKCIYTETLPGGIFVTYSAKGQVRRNLTAAGYIMERLPGPPGKKEMLRGIKLDLTP